MVMNCTILKKDGPKSRSRSSLHFQTRDGIRTSDVQLGKLAHSCCRKASKPLCGKWFRSILATSEIFAIRRNLSQSEVVVGAKSGRSDSRRLRGRYAIKRALVSYGRRPTISAPPWLALLLTAPLSRTKMIATLRAAETCRGIALEGLRAYRLGPFFLLLLVPAPCRVLCGFATPGSRIERVVSARVGV